MKNILFITKEIPYPADNGHRIRTLNLLRALSKGNNVRLVCFGNGTVTDEKEIAPELKDCYTSLTIIPTKQLNSKWKTFLSLLFSLFSYIPYIVRKRYSPLMKEKIGKLLKENNNDLIFCDSVFQAPYIPRVKVKKFLCEHNIESTIIRRYYKHQKNIFKKIYAYLEFIKMCGFQETMWKKFDRCFVVSAKDKEQMSRRARKKTEIIPNGVDIDYFSSDGVKVKPFSLIYTGQMDWFPNEDAIEYFLKDTYPLIKQQIPQVTFWIVGKNPTKKIKRLAKRDKSITLTGFVNDVRSYLSRVEVVIIPLRIASGTRLKILEAMATAKAIVSTSIGCEGLEAEHGKNILIADTPQEFANRVIDIFKSPFLGKKLGFSGRLLVEKKYSWKKISEDLSSIVSQELDMGKDV